jgi:hypothetical protein
VALDLAAVEGPRHDKAAATKALDLLAREPFDSAVAVASLARAALQLLEGDAAGASRQTTVTLDQWAAASRARIGSWPSAGSVDADVAEIRQVVFRPLGDLPVYSGMRLNAFGFPSALSPFVIVNPDVSVKTADGTVQRHRIWQSYPGIDHVLQLDSNDLALMSRLLPTLGGTKRRQPQQVMETPNQPVGDSMDVLNFWNRFFAGRPGHWGGWELDTYPRIAQIEFLDAARAKANAAVVIGYSGATVVLEKIDGHWRAIRLTNQWVT